LGATAASRDTAIAACKTAVGVALVQATPYYQPMHNRSFKTEVISI